MSFQLRIGKNFSLTIGKKSFEDQEDNPGRRLRLEVDGEYGSGMSAVDGDITRLMDAIWGYYADRNLITLYHGLPEIYAPIHHIAYRVADGNYQLKKIKDNSLVTDNEYINKLLESPNPFQNFRELTYEAHAYELVLGKNFLYANIPDTLTPNYKNVATLINLFADQVSIVTDPTLKLLTATQISDVIKSYTIGQGLQLTSIAPEKVLYTKHTSLSVADMKIRGKSPMMACQRPVMNLIAVYEARNLVYVKRGQLGTWVSKKSDASGMVPLTPTERQAAIKEYNEDYGIVKKKNPVGFLSMPLEFQKTSMSIQELMPFDETDADASAIFAVYNVPRELMPRKEGATFENQNQAEKGLYENVVIPRAKSWARSLSTFLNLTEYGLYIDVDFSHVKVLQENLKEKSSVDWRNNETSRVRFERGIITLNDWRKDVGMEPVKNAMYDKLIYEMTADELTTVSNIIKIAIGSNSSSENRSDDNVAGN